MILQWTMPQLNKKQELKQTSMALKLVQAVGGFIWRDSMYSFQFLYHQVRARLLSFSRADSSLAFGDFGVLSYEAKSVLVDILIVMCRLREREGFYLEPRLVIDPADKVEEEENNNNNAKSENEEETGELVSGAYEVVSTRESEVVSHYSSLESSLMTLSPVKLLTPKMIEDDVQSTRSNTCLLTDYRSPKADTEEEEYENEDEEDEADVVVEDITDIYQVDNTTIFYSE